MTLKNSELVLNPDGSIYHLNLHPEQVAQTIILVGDQDRVPRVSQYFDRVDHQVRKREFVTHTGVYKGTPLTVISTGIGPDNIDIVLNELDALHNIDLETRDIKPIHTRLRLVRMGTTGGLQAHTTAGSLVASTAGLGLDGLLHFYQAESQQNHPAIHSLKEQLPEWHFPVSPYFAEGDTHLVKRMVEAGYIAGITATNPGFYGPQGRQLRAPVQRTDYLDLLAKFRYDGMQIVNLEMETAAIYGLSQLLGHEALSLSVVLANRADGSFSTHPREDVQKLIEKSLDLIIEP